MTEFKVGQTVETSTYQQGIVRYVGQIHVAEGLWLGVELATATGKNDGSVRGERYFSCPPAHGLFVKDSSIVQIISQPAPPPARPAATPRTRPAATSSATPATSAPAPAPSVTGARPTRPSSVIVARTAPRAPAVNIKRQSVQPATSYTSLRAPGRKPSNAGLSAAALPSAAASSSVEPSARASASSLRDLSSRPSRPSLASSISSQTLKTSRDSNVETLQTKIRHLEKQHSEDQERLRELVSAKDERDNYHRILNKLQTKVQVQHAEAQELKEKIKDLQTENEGLSRNHQEHEVDLEDALVDKEMAEERAEQADAEIESLRKRLEERDLELEILREEAELYTTEMSEEQKQDAGYYRLQTENERLRQALIGLKEMTEEKEQDLKARILGLEADLANLDTYERDNASLQQRITEADAIAEDLRQRLDAASEWEDMVGELSNQNHDFQDRIAEQDLVIQDLENLRELNDELEIQHLEQEEELRAELEAKDIELVEQTRHINEQSAIIIDHEILITKFRDLVIDLQNKANDAESSRTMTEAQVKDTTGRFNEVMDINRQLRAATVQSTTREIKIALMTLKLDQLQKESSIWDETNSKDFAKSESVKTYLTLNRLSQKSTILCDAVRSTRKQMSSGGLLDDTLSVLVSSEAIAYLERLAEGSDRLYVAINYSSLTQFATFGPANQELITIEQVLDQGLNSIQADTVNFEELAGALGRSNKIHKAILSSHQEILLSRPEDEVLKRARSIKIQLDFIDFTYKLLISTLQKLPESMLEKCEDTLAFLKKESETTAGTLASATKFDRTLHALRQDGMYPPMANRLEEMGEYDDKLAKTTEKFIDYARKLIGDAITFSYLTDSEHDRVGDSDRAKKSIDSLREVQQWNFECSTINFLAHELELWHDHIATLMNCVEIEEGPTPWQQKAKEVEAARKKDEVTARQLETLTVEHRASLLKIHEKEQVIATKELKIEHLTAKITAAAAKTEDLDALHAELAERDAKIVELQAEHRVLLMEHAALKERGVRSEQSDDGEAETVTNNNTAGAEPVGQASAPQAAPAHLKIFMDALQNENHWLRERQYTCHLDENLRELFGKLSFNWDQMDTERSYPQMFLHDDSESEFDDLEDSSRSSSPFPEQMTPLGLRAVQLGWESRTLSLKEAFEARIEHELSIIHEEDESSMFIVDVP